MRYRFGLGRLAPWIGVEDHWPTPSLTRTIEAVSITGSEIRGGFGITERLSVEAAYTFDDFEARRPILGSEREQRRDSLTFDATSSLQLALGYRYRDGEVISYAVPPRPDIFALASARSQ